MNNSSKPSLMERHGIKIVLGLLVLSLAIGLTAWKVYNPQSSALSSKAGSPPLPHWAHSTIPFNLPLLNSSSKNWTKNHLPRITADWQTPKVMAFATTQGNNSDPCYLYPEMINFCSVNDKNDGIAYGQYSYWNETGHIVTAAFVLNDAYFYDPNSYFGTPEMRNKMLCLEVGFTLGLDFRYNEPDTSKTCMDPLNSIDRVLNQQDPDAQDYTQLKTQYNHLDDTSSSGVASLTAKLPPLTAQVNKGQLVKSSADGQQKLYKLDLGNGYTQMTLVVNKPATTTKTQTKK